MKKTILSLAVITATIFASCSKDSDVATGSLPTPDSVETSGGSVVSLTLNNEAATRADSDTVLAEEWESALSSLTIFAFDKNDNMLVRRSLVGTELTSKSVSFTLPKSTAGTDCTFYAIANYDASSVTSKIGLISMMESTPASYNGTYESVTKGAVRDGGFVMSDSTTKTIEAEGDATKVAITIKRTVAKVALNLSVSDLFTVTYPTATLTFNSTTISKVSATAPVLDLFSSSPATYSHTQSDGGANALFYIFGNNDRESGERVLLEISTTFDADGKSSTTADQSEVIYSIELEGDGAGAISRNGFYKVVATINGLVGQDCEVTVSVVDWATPTTQNVTLGM